MEDIPRSRESTSMSHKLDCTEKAYEIMMKQTTWKKWKIYRQALLDAGLYGGMAWSGDSKWPKVDIDTKEKFTESLLTQHCISHRFSLDLERLR